MSKPFRILQVFSEMNVGGAETLIMNLYRHIDRTKIQFDFIVHTEENCSYDDEIKSLGGKIYRVPKYKGINHLKYLKSWNTFFQNHPEYKIIHGHIRSTASIYLWIAKKFNLITIIHSHSTSNGSGILSKIKDVFQYPIRFISDYYFSCSLDAGKWLFGENKVKKENFIILNNSVDVAKFRYDPEKRVNIRKKLNVEDNIVIGHVGRFHESKNHMYLIDIFSEIHKKNPNYRLILVGGGDFSKVEKHVKDLGLEANVQFLGQRSDVNVLLNGFDIFLFPSKWEGFPVTVVEAQTSGLPCFLSNNITSEVDITNLVKHLSLDRKPLFWAKEILNIEFEDRNNYFSKIIKSGFSVRNTAKRLEKFYGSIL